MRKLQFKFPSQIRISGWDFGSSARAMNQAGGKDSLMTYENESIPQAELGKGLNSTTERKSMSTKTTIKRIALVAVSALGLGVLTSVAPASAADIDTATSGFTLNAPSFTIVGGGSGDYSVLEINTIGNNSGLNHSMVTSAESIKLTTTAWPTAIDTTTAAGDLVFTEVVGYATDKATGDKGSNQSGSATDGTIAYNNTSTDPVVEDGGTATATTKDNGGSAAAKGRYHVAISHGASKALDKGTYTVRVDLLNNGNVIQRSYVKVTFVTDKVDSGAVLTASAAGSQTINAASVANTTTNYLAATLADANGGLIVEGNNTRPSITAKLYDAASPANSDSVTLVDTGAEENDATPSNGAYEATSGALTSLVTKGTGSFLVRYGAASASAAATVLAAATATKAQSTFTISTPGASVLNTTTPFTVPLSTKTVTLSFTAKNSSSAVQPNHAIVATVTWSGNYAAGDVAPKSATPKVYYTDAAGNLTLDVTNNAPIDGATATIALSGCTVVSTSDACITSQVINWKKPVVTTVSVSPASSKAKYLSTTAFTATVLDQFGQPVVGEIVQPAITGANANTTALATLKTDAKGQVSYSLTDAAATATTTTDTMKFTTTSTAVTGSSTITYVTTVPVIASFTGYYELADGTGTYATPVPSTGIYTTTTGTTKLALNVSRNSNGAIAAGGSGDDLVGFRFTALTSASAAAAGVPVVVTVSKGGFILDANNLEVTSRTIITDASGYAAFVGGSNVTGATTFTVTSGTVSSTASIWVKNATTDARYVALSSANGDVTATVTDSFGNGVSGVTVQISTTVGNLGNGQKTASYTTDAAGQVTVTPQGSGDATITALATTSGANDFASLKGYVGTTAVESTRAAGNDTATLALTIATSATSDAIDAANEATDAANAATDAANAAAEAADAATAAAQDAQAAVAALATSVASLIAGIKAQITTLTNLVIKIQKKVKA